MPGCIPINPSAYRRAFKCSPSRISARHIPLFTLRTRSHPAGPMHPIRSDTYMYQYVPGLFRVSQKYEGIFSSVWWVWSKIFSVRSLAV